ncbi:MAG TPA: hypothetical protein VFJ17_08995 [Mycobacteriales bacterium]|nr:hypothetical protein [Mycobacteriales bacterium]
MARGGEAFAYDASRAPTREDSLRTALREYLAALDRGHLAEAELLARCSLGPRHGRVTLVLPLVTRPRSSRLLFPDQPGQLGD